MAHPPELRARARQMRKQGMLCRVIAVDLGVSMPTVVRWTNTELESRERIKARRRKFSAKKRCPKCKRKMSNPSGLCRSCYRIAQTTERYWTRERIIDAIQHWALTHGHAPTYGEWQRSGKGHPAVATIRDGPYAPFQSWGEAIVAAGFEPRKHRSGKRMTPTERAELKRRIREDTLKEAVEKGEQ